MSLLSSRTPTLTFIGMAGCEACAKVKPELERLRPHLGRLALVTVDLSKDTIDLPISAVPAFHLQLADGRCFMTDAAKLGAHDLQADAEGVTTWIKVCAGR